MLTCYTSEELSISIINSVKLQIELSAKLNMHEKSKRYTSNNKDIWESMQLAQQHVS